MSEDHDWYGDDAHLTVIHHQPETAVFTNSYGGVVVRQRADGINDDDTWVVILPENLPALIAALRRYLPETQRDAHDGHTSRPLTAAERKRLQRARERHEVTTDVTLTVTECHETSVTRRDVSRDDRDFGQFLDAPLDPARSNLFDRRKVLAPG